VVAFAVSMAWVEAAAVFYLRTLVDRIEPHQPSPLPLVPGLQKVELIREAATLIMLWTLGRLAGGNPQDRVGYTFLAFGVWDIFYYVFLRVLGPWPHSLWDWDLLFLLPLPWWAPLMAPLSIAALMVASGTLMTQHLSRPWPSRRSWIAALCGTLAALVVFMADALAALPRGIEVVRSTLPQRFCWTWFLAALVLMATPASEMAWKVVRHPSRTPSPESVP